MSPDREPTEQRAKRREGRRHWSGPTEAHQHIMFVVDQNGPVTVGEIARHLLADDGWVRGRCATLEWHGMLGRSYTRFAGTGRFGYEITRAGVTELAATDASAFEDVGGS